MLRKLGTRRVLMVTLSVMLLFPLALSVPVMGNAAIQQQSLVTTSGIQAPDLEATYRAAQTAEGLTEEARVRAAVDTYFKLKYESRIRQQALDPGFLIEYAVPAGRNLYEYEFGKLRYHMAWWQYNGTRIKSYQFYPAYNSIAINGDRAVVQIQARFDFIECNGQPGTLSDPHHVELVKTGEGWKLIQDSYQNESTMLYPYGTDFAALLAAMPEEVVAIETREAELNHRLAADPRLGEHLEKRMKERMATQPSVSVQGQPTGQQEDVSVQSSFRNYSPAKAAWYATTYTNNDGSNSTTNYNIPLFVNYAAQNADCQNFVSQCIWYGFGGSNTSAAINGRWLPMVNLGASGVHDWWATAWTSVEPWTWANVSLFEGMIKDNWNNDKVGVQGIAGSMSFLLRGDVVSMIPSPPHVFIINNVIDHNSNGSVDYNEIYVCAHTNNRKNVQLSSLVPNSGNVEYLWILTFKNP